MKMFSNTVWLVDTKYKLALLFSSLLRHSHVTVLLLSFLRHTVSIGIHFDVRNAV